MREIEELQAQLRLSKDPAKIAENARRIAIVRDAVVEQLAVVSALDTANQAMCSHGDRHDDGCNVCGKGW